jgi:hypothetical protein
VCFDQVAAVDAGDFPIAGDGDVEEEVDVDGLRDLERDLVTGIPIQDAVVCQGAGQGVETVKSLDAGGSTRAGKTPFRPPEKPAMK